MIFIPRNKNYLFFLVFVCINFNTAVAQVDSIQFFQKKITELSQSPDFTENEVTYINLLNNLSYQLRYTGRDSMQLLAKKALELSKLNKYKKGELEALTNFSAFYLYQGNTEKAIQYGLEVLNEKELVDYPNKEMKAYNQLGQAYFIKQDYPLTYTHFLHALSLGEKFNNEVYIFRMNMNLGTMFNLLEDYDEAIVFYSAALKSSKKLNDTNADAMLSSNLGYLYIQKGEFKKAEALLNNSIKSFDNQKINEWQAFSYATLGQLNIKLKNFNKALVNYEKALNIQSSINDIKGRADIYYGLAKANIGLKNLDKAEEYSNESLRLYTSFQLNTGLERCYRILYEIKKEQNQISKSLEYLEITEKLANDISTEKNKRNLNMLNAKLNFEKEKDGLKAKNELALNQQRKYVKWALAALLTSLIIVLIILNSNKRKKILNKKLENQAIILTKNQKTLSQINSNQDRLFSIVGHDLRGPIIALKELLKLYLEDPEGKDYFEKFAPQVDNDLEHVLFTMDNLLHWGKTQMTGNVINKERITIKQELEIILQLFRNEIEKKSILVKNQLKDNHFAFADLDQFGIVFRNLISNAIKFTPKNGKITVSSIIRDTKLVIQISDTGIGMTEMTVRKIFNNTEHFSTYGTNQEKGTGLGLRLAKEMLVLNSGEISVKSEPNLGSQFIVELPISTI
ncbi:tetratricopeptide repeat-containing sensor histidine kinase [Maribacter sp. ACAM166]|uniref:tetratricopeptide repeat-containing sensor histidine kinase n=1 Tax=Maribacter sp. ACAM166 TaxID=2508996 RepID=UPI0010FE7EB3|nr:tetratricopeptide repeat-containing sensor histidine kinase [Maribacter sp. ACAM166]TLP79618.1 tetratricopeptide repeat protein [Maribacter sp. ACAM166]